MTPIQAAQIAGAMPLLDEACAKIKATEPDCDICGKHDCEVVGINFDSDDPPCFCPDCIRDTVKTKVIFYKLCKRCFTTDENWMPKILQKYVYN